MPPKSRLRKIVDAEWLVQCASGPGLIREEVWEDEAGQAVRYNLAFVNHFLTRKDHGRVLGYDNAHGAPHRHFLGRVEELELRPYKETLQQFLTEVDALRRKGSVR